MSYVKLIDQSTRRSARKELPIMIGSGHDCDVIVNSTSMQAVNYILFEKLGRLFCYNFSDECFVETKSLQNIHLSILGPFDGSINERPVRRFAGEMLNYERSFFQRLPERMRFFLGGKLSQQWRLSSWIIGAIACYSALTFASSVYAKRDLFPKILPMEAMKVVNGPFKSTTKVRDFPKGVGFDVQLTQDDMTTDYLLSFINSGINYEKEVSLSINGHEIFASTLDMRCYTEECSEHVLIEKAHLKVGTNRIAFDHAPADSSYMIREILLRPVPMIQKHEVEHLQRLIGVATRYFEERGIVIENISNARNAIAKAIEFARKRQGTENYLSQAINLQKEIETEFKSQVKDLWEEFEMEMRLLHLDEAEKYLGQLAKLFPDKDSAPYQEIQAKRELIKENRL